MLDTLKKVKNRLAKYQKDSEFALEPSMMRADDVFLVSYPRSGNTWVRNIVANILYPEDMLTALSDLAYLVPDIYRGIPRQGTFSNPRVIKTHNTYGNRHFSHRIDLYRKNIYVVRHPVNALKSYHSYTQHTEKHAVADINLFISRAVHGSLFPGSWQEHVLSWKAMADELDMLFIRYEDLQQNTADHVARLGAFLGRPLTDDDVVRITKNSSRKSMVEMEKKGFDGSKSYEFIRQDTTKPREEASISDESLALIARYCHEVMALFDYDMESYNLKTGL